MSVVSFNAARFSAGNLRRYSWRIALLVLCQLLWGCQTGTAERDASPANTTDSEWRKTKPSNIRLQAEPVAALGLTCDKCSWVDKLSCVYAHRSPIIATVGGTELLSSTGSCMPADPGPHFPGICDSTRMYRFRQIEYLRNVPGASATATFETMAIYDEVYSPDFESFPAHGPVLQPGKRYVIFAAADRKDMGLAADWYINTACELPETH